MFAKLSGRSFQSWTALYEKDRWPVADLKDGTSSLSLFLVFLECTFCMGLAKFSCLIKAKYRILQHGGAVIYNKLNCKL